MKCRNDMWPDAGRWMAVFLIGCVLSFRPVAPAMAGKHDFKEGVRAPILLAKEGGKKRDRYENLPPEEKARLKKNLRQWQSLSPEEQQRMRKKMDQLNQKPPEAQKLYQKRFKQWQQLSPQEQERLKRQLNNWDNLSREEKAAIRGRFK